MAAAWGVSPYLVGQWRKALNVQRTIGTHQRLSEGVRAADPARARKMRRTHVGKPLPATTKAKMSAAHRRRGTRPPWLKPAWTPREGRLCRELPPSEVAKRTGRAIGAVYSRWAALGVPDGRRQRRAVDSIL